MAKNEKKTLAIANNKKIVIVLPPPFLNGNKHLHPRGDLPHQIVQLATCVKQINRRPVQILDAFSENISIDQVIKKIKSLNTEFLGIPLTITNRELPYAYVLQIHNLIKNKLPKLKIIIFNWFYPAELANKLLENKIKTRVQYFLFGDIEGSMPLLINELLTNNNIYKINGLIYKKNSHYEQTSKIHSIEDLDLLPIPDWSLLNFKEYQAMPHRHNTDFFYPINISRGCNWNRCTFCQELFDETKKNRVHYRTRSPKNIIKEIIQAKNKFKIQEIQFDSVQFPTDTKWLKEFQYLLKKNSLEIKWSCLSRITAVSFEKLKIMKESGCYNILFGIESFNQNILNFLRKGYRLEQINCIIRNCRRLKIKTTGSFLMGLPEETPTDIIKYALKAALLGIDYFQLFIAKWYANPPQEIKKTGQLSKKWDFSKYDFYGPIFLPKAYKSINHLKKTQKTAYLIFYLNPLTIIRYFSTIKNTVNIARIINAIKILSRLN